MASIISQSELWRELLSVQPYKPGQGNRARYGTLAAFALTVLLGAWAWEVTHVTSTKMVQWGVPFVGTLVGLWVSYRLVHFPRFADFLIATEAEMNKVKWPSRIELRSSTIVVLVFVLTMAVFLFAIDLFWQFLLKEVLGILKVGGIFGGGG